MHAQGLIVETDPDWVSPYGAQKDSNRRAFYSAVVTLTLGVLGRCDANTSLSCLCIGDGTYGSVHCASAVHSHSLLHMHAQHHPSRAVCFLQNRHPRGKPDHAPRSLSQRCNLLHADPVRTALAGTGKHTHTCHHHSPDSLLYMNCISAEGRCHAGCLRPLASTLMRSWLSGRVASELR